MYTGDCMWMRLGSAPSTSSAACASGSRMSRSSSRGCLRTGRDGDTALPRLGDEAVRCGERDGLAEGERTCREWRDERAAAPPWLSASSIARACSTFVRSIVSSSSSPWSSRSSSSVSSVSSPCMLPNDDDDDDDDVLPSRADCRPCDGV